MSIEQGADGPAAQAGQRVPASSRDLLIIHMGYPPDSIRAEIGDQAEWFHAAMGAGDCPVRVVRPFAGEDLPPPDTVAGAVITGSWAMVTDRESWSERTASWIRDAMSIDLPLLGVCYGHQLMTHALGGEVDFHPSGREIGMREVTLLPGAEADPLFGELPATLMANLTHEQSVLKPPASATLLGRSDHDAHQILRYGPNAWSIQFHPEFTPEIMAVCLERGRRRFTREGYDVDALLDALRPTPHALAVLRKFVKMSTQLSRQGERHIHTAH